MSAREGGTHTSKGRREERVWARLFTFQPGAPSSGFRSRAAALCSYCTCIPSGHLWGLWGGIAAHPGEELGLPAGHLKPPSTLLPTEGGTPRRWWPELVFQDGGDMLSCACLVYYIHCSPNSLKADKTPVPNVRTLPPCTEVVFKLRQAEGSCQIPRVVLAGDESITPILVEQIFWITSNRNIKRCC